MTNAEIILKNSLFLMEEGVLEPTAEKMLINGKEVNVPEVIHTFDTWKKLGYQVQKGEHAVAKFKIWKFKPNGKKKKDDEAEEKDEVQTGRCFMKMAFFFTAKQVQPISKEGQ